MAILQVNEVVMRRFAALNISVSHLPNVYKKPKELTKEHVFVLPVLRNLIYKLFQWKVGSFHILWCEYVPEVY